MKSGVHQCNETFNIEYGFIVARYNLHRLTDKMKTVQPTRSRTAVIVCSLVLLLAASSSPLAEEPFHHGLEIFTHKDQAFIAEDAVGLRFTGPIISPLAKDLGNLLLGPEPKYQRIMLELDSPGGDLEEVKKVIVVLKAVREIAKLDTRVMASGMCASGCVPIFMQGTKRKASGASVWMFHGAHGNNTNVPSPDATKEFLDVLTNAGVNTDFILQLSNLGYVTKPGKLWLSGYELNHLYDADILTELLPSWVPEKPIFVQTTPMMSAPLKQNFQPLD